jgi:hypothetical protein
VWRGPFKYGDLVSCQIQGKAISLGLVAVSWSQPVNEDSQAREVAVKPTAQGRTALLSGMETISYARHCFPPDVIRHAVWLYLRFTLSYRDVEDLLAERGLEISNEI